LGGKKTGPNPTDRAKGGSKRSLLTEANGIPVGLVVAGANVNDFKLLRETVDSVPIARPRPTIRNPQNLCLDKGHDYREPRQLVAAFRFTAHIRSRGEEAMTIKKHAGFRARRWVVERTHSWMNRFRRILVRWEKRADTYIAMLHFALALITWRASGLLG
jgi:transposase